jgi:5'-nucleotidase
MVSLRSRAAVICMLAAWLAFCFPASAAIGTAPLPEKKVTILMLNDVYQETPVDQGSRGGFARVATLRRDIMTKNPHAIFLFAGDTLSPSVASRTFRGKQMISAWNAVGLDVATLGNHEFDFGPNVLLERIAESRFKWVCANVIDKRTGELWGGLDPYVIKDVNGVKMGILGLLTPDTLRSSRPGPQIDITDPCEAAKKYVPKMRAEGAEIVVGLTHLNMAEDKELAYCAPFDVIVGGHEHVVLQSVANGATILKAGSDARWLGRIDVTYAPADKKVRSVDWELIPVSARIEDDPSVVMVVDEYESKLKTELEQTVGETSVMLDALQVNNQSRETNLGSFIADSYRAETGAYVVIFNGGSIRSNMSYGPGKLTRRDVLSILPFENPIVVIEVTGGTIRAALEHGVARIGAKSDGRFPQVSGLAFTYDASKPPGQRVVSTAANGQPLDEKKKYSLATNSYVTSGGDSYTMFADAKYLLKPEEGQAESVAFLNAIIKNKVIAPKVEGRIKRVDSPKS